MDIKVGSKYIIVKYEGQRKIEQYAEIDSFDGDNCNYSYVATLGLTKDIVEQIKLET